MEERIKGRLAAIEIVDPQTGEIIVERNEMIDEEKLKLIVQAKVQKVGDQVSASSVIPSVVFAAAVMAATFQRLNW